MRKVKNVIYPCLPVTAAKQTLEEEEKLREVCITFINMPVLHCIPWQKRSVGMTDCEGEAVGLKRCLFLVELSAHLHAW